jgi:hypothetical protein
MSGNQSTPTHRNFTSRLALWLLAFTVLGHAATFNACDYGAVGDDKTDNTDIYNVQASKLVCNGGSGIRARRIGSAPSGSK